MLANVEKLEGRIIKVPSLRLETLLARHLPNGARVDFLSVDVEGGEMEVLCSNDWERFRPRVVVIEVLHETLDTILSAPAIRFLTDEGYVPVSMLYHSVVLVGDSSLLAQHWGEPR